MSSALETLGSQHNGAKEYNQVGITLWKCIMILGLMLPFIGTVWYFTGDIFRALGTERALIPDRCIEALLMFNLSMQVSIQQYALSYKGT